MDNPDLISINLGFVNVYYLRGAGGGVLVDTGTPGSQNRILEALNQHNVEPNDIRCIVITHAHADHYGSLAALREVTGAPVLASRRAAEFIRLGRSEPVVPSGCLLRSGFAVMNVLGRLSKRAKALLDPELSPVDVDIVIDDVYDLARFGIAGKLLPTPGHTYGSLSVVLDAGDAIIGDSLMALGQGARVALAESQLALGESLARILALSPERIYLSHGKVYTREDIRRVYERNFGRSR